MTVKTQLTFVDSIISEREEQKRKDCASVVKKAFKYINALDFRLIFLSELIADFLTSEGILISSYSDPVKKRAYYDE